MTHIWESEFAAIRTVAQWNRNVIPWMKERGDEYKRFAHAEARRRGYDFDKPSLTYSLPWHMQSVKGTNLIATAWKEGLLLCVFYRAGGNVEYVFGDEDNPVPQEVKDKLVRSPFPDRLFTQIVKDKYPCRKVV